MNLPVIVDLAAVAEHSQHTVFLSGAVKRRAADPFDPRERRAVHALKPVGDHTGCRRQGADKLCAARAAVAVVADF